jgi:hypothetical protein
MLYETGDPAIADERFRLGKRSRSTGSRPRWGGIGIGSADRVRGEPLVPESTRREESTPMPLKTLITLHIIGAAALAGGHLIFALGVLPRAMRAKDANMLLAFSKAFTPVGHAALLIQIVTGLWLAMPYFANRTSATVLVEIKILLLILVLAITIHAKVRVAKRLPESMGAFAGHVVANAVLATALLVLGSALRFGGF